MPLYRRVYPKWHSEAWLATPSVIDEKDSTMLQSEDKEMIWEMRLGLKRIAEQSIAHVIVGQSSQRIN